MPVADLIRRLGISFTVNPPQGPESEGRGEGLCLAGLPASP
jgi:hypothetical protein